MPPAAHVQTVLAVPGYLVAGDAEGRRAEKFEVFWEDEPDEEKRLARWSAESTRKFLSAPAAVGTVDQVLLAGLRVKWAHFRAASLSRSLLVVDEVHASDAYMTELLFGVLRGHLALGGHALLMSATLGSAARSKFMSSSARFSLPAPHDAEDTPYPALTLAAGDGAVWERDVALSRMTDYQTAQLGKNDRAWTTRGVPAGRAGGAATYMGAHQRWRDYHADLRLAVVLRLDPADLAPTIDVLAAALDRPARPLFIGRKSCLPSAPIFGGWVTDAPNACEALRAVAPADASGLLAFWPETEGAAGAYRTTTVTDERNWVSGLHGGGRRICEGSLSTSRDEA